MKRKALFKIGAHRRRLLLRKRLVNQSIAPRRYGLLKPTFSPNRSDSD